MQAVVREETERVQWLDIKRTEGGGEIPKERTMAGSSGVMEIFGGQDFLMPCSVREETVPAVFIDYILINSSRGSYVHLLISFL